MALTEPAPAARSANARGEALPPPDLSIVIVSWSVREQLLACLESLGPATAGLRAQVVVVDNASPDGSASAVREGFPEVELIENRRNAGFARANNQAFARCRGRHVLLLNPDTVVNAEAIRGLLEFVERTPRCGGAGLQLKFPDGRKQNSYDSLPTFGSELISKHLMRLLFPRRYPSKRTVPPGPIPVEIVIGACLLLRREVLEALGGFDEGYFLFMEEADLCWRVRRAGWDLYHLPHLSIVHDARASKAQATSHAYIEYARSSYRFYRRCLGPGRAALIRALKMVKAVVVNPLLSLTATAFTLGRVPRHLRRLAIRGRLCAWHLLGCPAAWGMREVSHPRGQRRVRAGGLELVIPSPPEPEVERALRRALGLAGVGPTGDTTGAADEKPPARGTAPGLETALFRPTAIGRPFSLDVPDAILFLERALEVADRGIPVVLPLAAGARKALGISRRSAAVFPAGRGPMSLRPLAEALQSAAGRPALLERAGRFLRKLHDAGVDPGAAGARALGVRRGVDGLPDLCVADPRRFSVGPPLAGPRRAASLRALERGLAEAGGPEPFALPRMERLRFLAGYRRGAGGRGRRGDPPLRVLHLYANHKATGPALAALDAVRALGALPHVRPELQTGVGPGEESLARLAREQGVPRATLEIRLQKHITPAVLGAARRLRAALAESPPDVIHCHLPADHLAAALGAPPGVAVVRTVHDGEPSRWTWRVRRTLLGRADRVVCFSRAVGDALAEAGVESRRIVLLEPPIDLERFDRRRPLPDGRAALGLPRDAVVFGIAARIQPRRRFDVLLEAFARARRVRPELRLVVIGRGTREEEAVGEPLRRLGLEGSVVRTGYLEGDAYVAALAALDAAIFLVPGTDGTCRAVREAMALGIPVVSSRRGMLPQLVRDGVTGVLVDDGAEPLAEAMLALAAEPERRARLGRAARKDAEACFSLRDHARALAQVYREALAERSALAQGSPPAPDRSPRGWTPGRSTGPGDRAPPSAAAAGFLRRRGRRGVVFLRAGLDAGAVEGALDRFEVGEPAVRALKRDVKSSVFCGLDLAGRPLCLKSYRSRRRARRALRNLLLLARLGVPVPQADFLWLRPAPRGGGAVLGMEDLRPAPQLDRWMASLLASRPPVEARAALREAAAALGGVIRDLHDRGVWLDDLKTCNVFLSPEGSAAPRFRFIDVDGARPHQGVGLRRRVKNLAQLNRSTPVAAGLSVRRAFALAYRRGMAPATWRRLRRAVVDRSGLRPVLYVAPSGDVREDWPERAALWPR